MMKPCGNDRYVSFDGIDCDSNASRLLEIIQQHLSEMQPLAPWPRYFDLKLASRKTLGQDDLFFIGSQICQIREFLEQVHDHEALELLDQVEEECC
jgi:hypothetical protein